MCTTTRYYLTVGNIFHCLLFWRLVPADQEEFLPYVAKMRYGLCMSGANLLSLLRDHHGAINGVPVLSQFGACRDDSLASLLHEAFKLLEHRFLSFDQDGAGSLLLKELENMLSLTGFVHHEKLASHFARVDSNGSGALDFKQFLCLLFIWGRKDKIDVGKLSVKELKAKLEGWQVNW
jgi:hypothetical protein